MHMRRGRRTTSYLVCATPRSGSTLLCEALKATGVAGRPEEYFEAVPATGLRRRPRDYLEGLDDPEVMEIVGDLGHGDQPEYSSLVGIERYSDHLERVRRWGTTRNGVFGAKLMWGQLVDLAALATGDPACAGPVRGDRALSYAELLSVLFDDPRYIWVRRCDSVRQAVSLWRAMQTQFWRAEVEPPVARPGGPELRYSFAALRHLHRFLCEADRAWARFFAGLGDRALVLTYEELDADLPTMVRRSLEHLDIPAPDAPLAAPPQMRRQADELSEAWVAAYQREAAALPSPT